MRVLYQSNTSITDTIQTMIIPYTLHSLLPTVTSSFEVNVCLAHTLEELVTQQQGQGGFSKPRFLQLYPAVYHSLKRHPSAHACKVAYLAPCSTATWTDDYGGKSKKLFLGKLKHLPRLPGRLLKATGKTAVD